MRRSIARAIAITVLSVGALAGVAGTSSAATATTDTGGTLQHIFPLSTIVQLTTEGIHTTAVAPASESIDTSNLTATFNFPVVGGNGNVQSMSGSVDLSGSITLSNTLAGTQLTLRDPKLNLTKGELIATPAGTSTPIVLEDTRGVTTTAGSQRQSYHASEVVIDSAGAAYVDHALKTTVFAGGQKYGSLAATWTI